MTFLKINTMKITDLKIMLILCFFAFVGFAQQNELDKIKLNDKTIYTGRVVSQKPGEHIRFLIENSTDTLLIKMDQIDEISKISVKSNPQKTNEKSFEQFPFNTNRFQTSLSYYNGGGDVRFEGFGIGMHYGLSQSFALGITTSYFGETGSGAGRGYQWQKVPIIFESVYEYQKYAENKMALFAKIGFGYSFTLNGTFYDNFLEGEYNVSNGIVFNPGFGFRYNFSKNLGSKIELSYLLISDKIEKANGEKLSDVNWNVFMLKLSFFF
jgi:hypothetical protein